MKCIQNVETEDIQRVTDLKAMHRVFKGGWKYVPKSLWKAQKERAGGKKQ